MKHLKIALGVLSVAVLAAPTATAALLEGTYRGSAPGISAAVAIGADGRGNLRFTFASDCGKSKGVIKLTAGGGKLKGSRSSAKSSMTAQFKEAGEGTLNGRLKHRTKSMSRADEAKKCTDRGDVSLALDAETSPAINENVGHYEGSGEDGGHPISFDVVYDAEAGSLEVESMSFETDTECWDDYDGDGKDDTLVVKASGLEGPVDEDGYFDLELLPNAETELYASGVLEAGEAEIDIEVGGYFNADGTASDEAGPYECDSFGEVYRARRG